MNIIKLELAHIPKAAVRLQWTKNLEIKLKNYMKNECFKWKTTERL